MKISQLPRPSHYVLEVIYQHYLQNNYVKQPIPYDNFDYPKDDLKGLLDILIKCDFLERYVLHDDGLVYDFSKNGIISCEGSSAFKTSMLLIDLDVSAEGWVLLDNFISEMDNFCLSVIDRKYNLKEQLVKLINEVDAESLADVLSELLCH